MDYQRIFDHFHENHDLTLLESEMQDIVRIALEEGFDDRLESMYKDEPAALFHFMIVCAGKICADANSEQTTVSAEMTFNEIRYKAEAVIKLTRLHNLKNKQK